MQKTSGTRRGTRVVGVAALLGSLVLGYGTAAVGADNDTVTPAATAPVAPAPAADEPAGGQASITAAGDEPYPGKPVVNEGTFSRPYKGISSAANSDFALLDELERLIRGSYRTPGNRPKSQAMIRSSYVYMTINRMEGSKRVGRELIRAAKAGVKVRVLHSKDSQTGESRALQRALNSKSMRDASFRVCSRGKSFACLSPLSAATLHSKILLVSDTYTREGDAANSAIWTGSANLGGPSAEKTYNNGWTTYNDKKLWLQMTRMWSDMASQRNIGTDYMQYIKRNPTRYGYSSPDAIADGYERGIAKYGMFYSNLSNTTIYATPIRATPFSGRDPILAMLNRVVPDDQCRIRVMHNRFKYRKLSVAYKLTELANQGCDVSVVAYNDDSKANRALHCGITVRVCRPVLDVLKTANRPIKVASARPHDKTMLIEAKMLPNKLNPEELQPNGQPFPATGARLKIVQAGSATLTTASLASDEVTTETTDPVLYDEYLAHFKAILKSRDYRNFPY